MATKFDWGSYFQPTPRLFRKIGDSILAAGTAVSLISLIAGLNVDDPETQKLLIKITVYTVLGTALGKFLSNFFKDDPNAE